VHEDVSAALRKERSEILVSLRKIMEAMKSEAGGAGGVVVASSSKEMEKLRAENEELKKTNAKQRYRIEHLVHNLREKWQGGDV
jgi:cell division protein FtsB